MLETEEGARITVKAPRETADEETERQVVFDIRDLSVYYGSFRAVRNVTIPILENEITALIGPSGCGKTTFLRCLNRMNDLIESARIEGTGPVSRRRSLRCRRRPRRGPSPHRHGVPEAEPVPEVDLRQRRVRSEDRGLRRRTWTSWWRSALHRAALWDEVKDKLKESGLALSGGQQQRLCIARAIATRPDVILMDEPCSSLDPIATAKIEDLMQELVSEYTIVIVTHNMQQAARVSDRTAFFTVDVSEEGHRTGTVVEFDRTETIFTNPGDERTEAYVTGRFG